MRKFPRQICVLKGNYYAALANLNATNLADEFIDYRQTAGIVEFIEVLEASEAGNERIQEQLSNRGQRAQKRIDFLEKQALNLPENCRI